ncbi:GTPase [Jiangella mangrovi]|uniref:GTP-binding protein EngB required for normal cell division n=1 Tax=Jiangella mangrovi TaxID=1524084 RepID=A0A7W9GVD5_9ACTN|nr:GTPase [Jiangella mangrovi]MBB5790730.1 GTP-binding protein EngB required for normal cell division [Jiangella mangrovi]
MKRWSRRDRITLPERVTALQEAVAVGGKRLSPDLAETVQVVVDRAGERRQLSVEHTVVALAGATGSGKSTLFNRIAGMEVSVVGVRRPTTSDPLACVWGTQGVIPLLDWLKVPPRHRVSRESVLDSGAGDDLDGLVLLDLPDHDSTQLSHRDTVDRLVEMVDLFVWILDPQKYADAALHERYLRPLASHQAVTVIVLNQIDRLTRADVVECVTDLRGLLDADGLDEVPVVALSGATGDGVDTLVDLIRTAVTKRRAVDERIEADIRMTAELVASAVGDGAPGSVGAGERERLASAVAEASGADVVATAAGRSYLQRARAATGWPVTRWLGRLRRDPLAKLGVRVRRSSVLSSSPPDAEEIARISLPVTSPVQRSRSDAAVRAYGDAAAGTLPSSWRDAVRSVATSSSARLSDELDRRVGGTDFGIATRPGWWRLLNALQWLALLTAAAGVLWLLALAGTSFLRFDVAEPSVGGIPVPTVLLAGGLVLGVLVGLAGLWAARRGSRRQEERVRHQLRDLIASVTDEVVVEPVDAELGKYRAFKTALDRARS